MNNTKITGKVTIDVEDFDRLRDASKKLDRIYEVAECIKIKHTETYREPTTAGFAGGEPYVANEDHEKNNIILNIKRIL